MALKNRKQMQWISLITSLVIGIQMIMITYRGNAICLDEGCKIVERLTTISPLYFNMMGLFYFLLLLFLLHRSGSYHTEGLNWTELVLLSGMAVEGVLLSYQMMVAQVLCIYCLFIFMVVLLLNVLAGKTQSVKAISIFIAVNLISLTLSFGPSVVLSQGQSLSAGTYATSRCSNPSKELFLIFSEDCPHCQKVIEALESCNSCDFHFNPVGKINHLDLEGFKKSERFSPEINRVILSLLGIETVPVLLVKNPDGYSFIHGENQIIRYIEKACFRPEPLLYFDTKDYISQDQDISVFDKQEGECDMILECDEP